MKNLHLLIAICLLAIGCSSIVHKDEVQEFIPGTYISAFTDSVFTNTYTIGFDTLRIAKQTTSGSKTFQVERSLKYTRTVDGKEQPTEAKHETWTASYQPADKTLNVTTTGGTIAFDVKKAMAKIGSKEYKKIE